MKSIVTAVVPLLALSACATRPDSVQPRPIAQSEYAAYSCDHLRGAYANMLAQESKMSNDMNSTANSQLGVNVLGGVLMSTTGIGFARVTNNKGHAHALAGARGHLIAIRNQAKDMACELPEQNVAAQ